MVLEHPSLERQRGNWIRMSDSSNWVSLITGEVISHSEYLDMVQSLDPDKKLDHTAEPHDTNYEDVLSQLENAAIELVHTSRKHSSIQSPQNPDLEVGETRTIGFYTDYSKELNEGTLHHPSPNTFARGELGDTETKVHFSFKEQTEKEPDPKITDLGIALVKVVDQIRKSINGIPNIDLEKLASYIHIAIDLPTEPGFCNEILTPLTRQISRLSRQVKSDDITVTCLLEELDKEYNMRKSTEAKLSSLCGINNKLTMKIKTLKRKLYRGSSK